MIKYEDILNKKFLKFLKSIKKDSSILDKEEKYFKALKKSIENKSTK